MRARPPAQTSMQSALSCLYPLEAGSIRLDGVDLQSLRLAAVRKAICAVPQDPVLFSGSIRSNLYSEGDEGAAPDSDQLWCAAPRPLLAFRLESVR